MSLLQEYIEQDKRLCEIVSFFIQNSGSIQGLQERAFEEHVLSRYNKISVFEENNRIYKVFSKHSFLKAEAVYTLADNVLNLDEIIAPITVEYCGHYLAIISQEKLIPCFNAQMLNTLIPEGAQATTIYSSRLYGGINQILANTTDFITYQKFIELIELLEVNDMSGINNFGLDATGKLKCLDFENFNHFLTFSELKVFLEKYDIQLADAVSQYPMILTLVEKRW